MLQWGEGLLNKKIIICLNNFIDVLCIYLGEGEGRGGGLLMHVYVLDHKAFPTEPIDGC